MGKGGGSGGGYLVCLFHFFLRVYIYWAGLFSIFFGLTDVVVVLCLLAIHWFGCVREGEGKKRFVCLGKYVCLEEIEEVRREERSRKDDYYDVVIIVVEV